MVTYFNPRHLAPSTSGESRPSELILEAKEFSRFGKESLSTILQYARRLRAAGIRSVFLWDVLSTEDHFEHLCSRLLDFPLFEFDSVRVYDPGALKFVMEHFSDIKIQLSLERGNHNIRAVQGWCRHIGRQLERVILSMELSRGQLKDFIEKAPCPVEFLGLGKILLFYTPRQLLGSHIPDQGTEELRATASSEETPHKGFLVVENQNGTFMFHPRDFCLLEYIRELTEIKLDYFQVDWRFIAGKDSILNEVAPLLASSSSSPGPALIERIKKTHLSNPMRGFFHKNKSDVIFDKLKNEVTNKKGVDYLGQVLEANKKGYVAVLLANPDLQLNRGESIKLITPEKKQIFHNVHVLKDSSERELERGASGQLVLLPYIKGVTAKTMVYR